MIDEWITNVKFAVNHLQYGVIFTHILKMFITNIILSDLIVREFMFFYHCFCHQNLSTMNKNISCTEFTIGQFLLFTPISIIIVLIINSYR